MQTRIIRLLFLLVFSAAVFTSCKKTNKPGKQIPSSASFVLMINGEAVNSKLSWDDIKQNQLFKDMASDTSVSQYVKEAMENPDNTGIDVKDDILFYVQQDSVGGYAVLQGKIKDAAKFQAFFANVTKATVVAGKKSENSLSNDKMIATWDKDRYALVFDFPEMGYANIKNIPFPDMSDTVDIAPIAPPITKKRDMAFAGNAAFFVDENNSLANDEKFTELLSENGDVHFWMNSERLTGNVGMGALDMLSIGKLYKGVYFTGTATFLDGKIELNTKSYAGKELTDLFKKYKSKNIDESFLKRLPSKDVAMVAAMNYPPEGLLALVKLAGMEGFANMGASSLGFTLDDFVKANKGDLLVSVSGLKSDTAKSTADIFFSTSINDKAAFNKLMEAGKKMMAARAGDTMSKALFQNSNGNYFAMGTNKADVDAFFKNENNNNAAALPGGFTGNPIAVYVNFQNIFRSMTPRSSDSLKVELHRASLQMWDNMLMKGGEFKGGGILQKIEVNLLDKKLNSLKQLNNYFGVLGAIDKKNKRMNPWSDSTRVSSDTTFATQSN